MSVRILCLLALALAPATAAQSVQRCVPFPVAGVWGPDPIELPQPYASDELQAEAPSARVSAGVPLGLGARIGAEGACPDRIRARPWTGTDWGADTLQTDVTFTDGLPTRTDSEITRADGSLSVRRITYAYDAAGRLVDQLSEQGEPLEPVVAYRYTYDADGRLARAEIDILNGQEVSLALRESYTYDGSAPYAAVLLTEERVDGVWRFSYRSSRTYTDAGQRLLFIDDISTDGTTWTLYQRLSHTYDAGRLLAVATDYRDGSAWQPASVTALAYDAEGRLTRRARQSPSGVPSRATDFVYDGARLAEATDFDSEPGAPMLPVLRTRYTFEDGIHTASEEDRYEGSAWAPAERRLYVRDEAGRPTERVDQRWADGAFVNGSQTVASYGGAVAAEDTPAAAALALRVGPNPTGGAVTARFTLGAPGRARLTVSDALGRLVQTSEGGFGAGSQVVALDLGRRAPGLYVVRLVAGAQTATRTLTVAR